VTALIVGFAIGLAIATVIVGYRIRRTAALRQLQLDEFEAEIPAWVNQAPAKVIRLQDLVDAINFQLWEDELEGHT
jgi:hypothetical protein